MSNYSAAENNSGEPLLISEDIEMCAPYHIYLNLLHTYYVPFIIAVGLLGNLLSYVVFLTTPLKTRSSSYYLAALAMADFGFLLVLLVVHCSFNNVLDIFNKDGWCQTFVYVSSVCANLSVWFIVAFTVERFIAVQYPLQRPQICTVSRAKTIVIVITVVALITQSYVFKTAGIIEQNGYAECEMLPVYHSFMNVVNCIDTFATLIVPLVLIVVMNTMIARNLFLFRKRLQSGSLDECLYDDAEHTELQRTHTASASSRRPGPSMAPSINSNKSLQCKGNRKKQNQYEVACIQIRMSARNVISPQCQRNINKMLLLIDSVFITLNLPSYVIRLYIFFVYRLWEKDLPEFLWCFQQFAMLLYYTNFSINFLLYAMCGITFRRRMWQLVRNKLKRIIITKKPYQFQ